MPLVSLDKISAASAVQQESGEDDKYKNKNTLKQIPFIYGKIYLYTDRNV